MGHLKRYNMKRHGITALVLVRVRSVDALDYLEAEASQLGVAPSNLASTWLMEVIHEKMITRK